MAEAKPKKGLISHGIAAQNRKARYDYTIKETVEAGLVLKGPEVKSLRHGRATLNEAWAGERDGEQARRAPARDAGAATGACALGGDLARERAAYLCPRGLVRRRDLGAKAAKRLVLVCHRCVSLASLDGCSLAARRRLARARDRRE